MFRAYHHQTPAIRKAKGAVNRKDSRQPKDSISHAIRGAVAAAPSVSPVLVSPFGNAQPDTGNQLPMAPPQATGNTGACTTPIRNRRTMSVVRMTVVEARVVPGTKPVANVRIPHNTAMIDSARRLPTVLPKMPPGNWKMAYPQAKAERIMPS